MYLTFQSWPKYPHLLAIWEGLSRPVGRDGQNKFTCYRKTSTELVYKYTTFAFNLSVLTWDFFNSDINERALHGRLTEKAFSDMKCFHIIFAVCYT